MAASRLAFGLDEEGDEVLEMHSAAGEPTRGPNNKVVMMRWEQPYMEALVEALELQATDEALEIGFGLGYSARAIQRRRPRRHVIIEPDAAVLERAHAWASEAQAANPGGAVEIIAGYWQEALAGLGRFDAVFLDDFPLPLDDEEGSSKERRQAQRDEQRILAAVGSRWHAFLDLAVSHHLRPGGRVTGYLSEDLDLGRPGCSYTRRTFEVQVPPHCPYARPGTQTYLIPVLRMVDDGHAHAITTGRRRGDEAILAQDAQGQAAAAEAGEGWGATARRTKRQRQRMIESVMAARGEETGDV